MDRIDACLTILGQFNTLCSFIFDGTIAYIYKLRINYYSHSVNRILHEMTNNPNLAYLFYSLGYFIHFLIP